MKKEGRLSKKDVIKLIKKARKLFYHESNVIHVEDPLVIVGDIHG